MRIYFFLLLLSLLLAFSFAPGASAESLVYYQASGYNNGPKETGRYASYPAACVEMATLAGMVYESSGSGTLSGSCYGKKNNTRFQSGTWRRIDQECPAGITNLTCNASCDPPKTLVNGQCIEPDPCYGKTGGTQNFVKSGSSGDGYGSVVGGFVVSSQSGCFGGCAVSTADQKCTGRTSGAYTCRGTASFSGQSCSTSGGGTEIQDNTANEPKPEPQIISDDKPCIYSSSGEGQSCTSEKNTEHEGQFCGTVDGKKFCTDTKPTKNGIKIDTNVKTVTNPDGSKVTTKTDVATKTTCTGAGQCTSTSTTTTTTTNTSSSGATTGTTGSCTGASCPDKNTNPDGDGDGFGDCTGTDCGEGAGGDGELLKPELEEVDSYQETTQKFYNRVNNAPLFSAVGNIHAPIVGTAPTLVSAPIAALGGASLDLSFIDELKPILSSILSFVMKAVWCLLALVIFLSA